MKLPEPHLRFDQPAIYRLKVLAAPDFPWVRISNMQITLEGSTEGKRIVVLVGKVADQAELHGIFSTLYEMHIPLISVTQLRAESDTTQGLPLPINNSN